jgi:hypothetical protein
MKLKPSKPTCDPHLVLRRFALAPRDELDLSAPDWYFLRVGTGVGYRLHPRSNYELATSSALVFSGRAKEVVRCSQVDTMQLQLFRVQPERLTGLVNFSEQQFLQRATTHEQNLARFFDAASLIAQKFRTLCDRAKASPFQLRLKMLELFIEAIGRDLQKHWGALEPVFSPTTRLDPLLTRAALSTCCAHKQIPAISAGNSRSHKIGQGINSFTMTTRNLIPIGAIVCSLFAVQNMASAQGSAFTYQGFLSSGVNPANGPYDVTFSLYNASTNGNQVASTITNRVQVINGLFTTVLDFGPVFSGTSYWLEIGVSLSGANLFTTVLPRQFLSPTPYAITSGNISVSGISVIGPTNYLGGNVDVQSNLTAETIALTGAGCKFQMITTSSNALGIGVQTNLYGGFYTNQFQMQTIDMRNTRTILGLYAGNYALTNNSFNSYPPYYGDDSTFLGFAAGFSQLGTMEQFNTAVGAYALGAATNGAGNVAVGQKAMINGTNCQVSVAVGGKALSHCPAPARDTAVGYAAMQFALGGDLGGPNTGGDRTAIGYAAGQYDDGLNNTWVGAGAGPQAHAAPEFAIGIGTYALNNVGSSSYGCVGVGGYALFNLTENSGCTAIGYQALESGASYQTTAIGYNAGENSAGATGSIFIGAYAGISSATWHSLIIGGNEQYSYVTNCFLGADQQSVNAAIWGPLLLSTTEGSGLNSKGMALTIAAGAGTGNANGGTLNLAVGLPGTSGTAVNSLSNIITVSGASGVTAINGNIATTARVANGLASVSFPAPANKWTNTNPYNIVVYINNPPGTFGSAIYKNSTQIGGVLAGSITTLLMKPGDYFSETYTAGMPTATWEPF